MCCFFLRVRVLGDRRRVPLAGDRRAGPAAAEGGPPAGGHEHQAGPRAEDLRPDLPAEGLLALLPEPLCSLTSQETRRRGPWPRVLMSSDPFSCQMLFKFLCNAIPCLFSLKEGPELHVDQLFY